MNSTDIFATRLVDAMRLRGMKAIDIVNKTSISKPMMTHYTSGRNKPSPEKMAELATVLNVAPEWLDGYDVPMEQRESNLTPLMSNKVRQINLLEFISCGCGTYNDGTIVSVLTLPEELFVASREYFAITAKGDSMINAGIEDGDILIFERVDVPSENKIGAFCLENEYALCKRYKTKDGKIYLLSANDEYAPIVIDPMDECFRCVGLLSSVTKKIKE